MKDDIQEHGPGPGQPIGPEGWFEAHHAHPHHPRGPRHGRSHDRDWGGFFGGGGRRHRRGSFGGHHGGGWGGFGPGGLGQVRERLERGVLRYVILDVLRDGPKHGYEIIKHLEERTGGRYSPSPGTLYPTLQYLDDLGLVRADQEDGRRVYELTDAGRAELEEHSGFASHFWSRFGEGAPSGSIRHEITFLKDALHDLSRTVAGSIHSAVSTGNPDTVRQVRQALERCQNEIREIIAQSASSQPLADDQEAPAGSDNPGAQGREPNRTDF